MEKLHKKYGLFTAICMVVGIVIGSGIFFKAQDVLKETGGNAIQGVLAWVVGGIILIVLSSTFAIMATKYEKVNGVVDYAEVTCGKKYAYYVGWFMNMIYYPAMTSVLAWVSARYTMVAVFGVSSVSTEALFGPECIAIASFYLLLAFFINSLAPKFAGKVQISTTIIKLIPLAVIALVGSIVGLFNGTLTSNFVSNTITTGGSQGGMIAAICCTAFAYEGWIIATTINAEIKDSKKNLPIALFIGSIIIVVAYVLCYIGFLGLEKSEILINNGTSAAFKFFGGFGSVLINFLIIISCLGTLNGLMLGCTRGIYSLAVRNEGISPKTFCQIDRQTNMPHNSAIFSLMICGIWFVYFLASQFFGWFGNYGFDSSELPIITIYPLYIPILIQFMRKEKDLNVFKRFVLPVLSIIGSLVMVFASIVRHKISNVWYLIVFAIVMVLGFVVEKINNKKGVIVQNITDEEKEMQNESKE